ncbi:hypothetical protein FUAX_42640 (plasmid) [Fulvitalea axinellae]|uniref:DUF4249 domain-containing protein n=1 Tax=Fulvitalea axinellae TaxID=1182444 RepID=A0AAU9CV18_9BACT|nr:hypothetical protein FUAX_42640 [Fulvitalea axinellae]
MKYLSYILYLPALIIFGACTEEFEFEIDESDSKTVIEAQLTDLAQPQKVRITKLAPDLGETTYDGSGNDKQTPVSGATVSITDEEGNVHVFAPQTEQYSGKFEGYYVNEDFHGEKGKRYTLKVIDGDKVYTASETMPAVPVIDAIEIRRRQSEIPGKSDQYVPYISFDNPKTKDFFRFAMYSLSKYADGRVDEQGSNRIWEYSILSDRFLPERVNNLAVNDGQSPDGKNFYPGSPGNTVRVYMSSITEGAFAFYESLVNQFDNDGGIISPAPASAPTNISGGAIGYFIVASSTYKDVTVPDEQPYSQE